MWRVRTQLSFYGFDFKTAHYHKPQLLDLAAYSAQVCHERPPSEKNQRAQGMPGARCARSLACSVKKHTSVVTTVTPVSPGIPRAMVLTVSFVLSPAIVLVLHLHLLRCLHLLHSTF